MASSLPTTPCGVPEKFHLHKLFVFPKRKFGKKGEERSFRTEWCAQYPWLHYDTKDDAAFCHLCMTAAHQRKFISSTKRDPAFITKGYTYWKEATTAFKKHQTSECHREANEAIVLRSKEIRPVDELLSEQNRAEKECNRKMFLRILQTIRFLARQGLPLRGKDGDSDSNFTQLLRLQEADFPEIKTWLSKKANKYTSHDIQNECLQIMALHILRQVSRNIQSSCCYTIMADECTDVSNKEQFTINLRWVKEDLTDHEEFIGLYCVDNIDANSLVRAIKDCLLRLGLQISCCRGQCYDGASNMSGSKNGVATQICSEEKRALYVHCHAHALNLAVGDCIKHSKVCREALETAFEISRLIKFSPKRNAAFDKIKTEIASDESPIGGIRTFCPTRWTVRGNAVKSILQNYCPLNQLWEESLKTRLDPDVKGRIIGVKAQMSLYNMLFGLKLCERILCITDNLSKTLQTQSLSASEAQQLARLTSDTLKGMRTDQAFELFFQMVEHLRNQTETAEPSLPRRRKAPKRYEVGEAEGYHSPTVEDHYRRYYFEAIDLVTHAIDERFDQPGYAIYRNLEEVLIKAANNDDYTAELQEVIAFYGSDLKADELSTQLSIFTTKFTSEHQTSKKATLGDVVKFMRSLTVGQRIFFSEVCNVVRLILVLPATNAVSERSFSTMRRIKSYLRSTTGQARLNHLMLLNIYIEKLDGLDLKVIANEFVRESEHRQRLFGTFI